MCDAAIVDELEEGVERGTDMTAAVSPLASGPNGARFCGSRPMPTIRVRSGAAGSELA